MPSAPVVETARLTLRPPVETDRDAWTALHRDARTYVHAPWAMAATDEAAGDMFEANQSHWQEHGFGYWVAESRTTGYVVGACGVRRVEYEGDAYLNLYYRLDHEHLGRGLGTEMARVSVAHAVEHGPGLPVWALVGQNNPASIHTAEAAGLTRFGQRHIKGDPGDRPPGFAYASPHVDVLTSLDHTTRASILDLWMRTNDGGGAVGFLPGASRDRVEAALSAHEASMAAGETTAVVLRSAVDAQAIGLAFIVPVGTPLMPHVASVYRVMTEPTMRGRNLGRLLMSGVHRAAGGAGIEILTLGVRSGMGTSAFYEACGYRESGRILGAIRVAPGDDRDDITMTRRLDHKVREPDPRS
jgi:RimJ/RimL family protein N-acetyltransferase/ribosomal protein S18 acetylase RimI-like enzyme